MAWTFIPKSNVRDQKIDQSSAVVNIYLLRHYKGDIGISNNKMVIAR